MELVWDDLEERRYREWLKMELEKKEEAEFSEFSSEEEYRRRMREEAEQRGGDQVGTGLNTWVQIGPIRD